MAHAEDKLMPWFSGWTAPGALGAADGRVAGRVQPAEVHLPYAVTVLGSHRATPGGPVGALYGRTEARRTRRARIQNLRGGEGVN